MLFMNGYARNMRQVLGMMIRVAVNCNRREYNGKVMAC